MSEIICEEIAHRAGFIVSVGNWIAPDGGLITGWDYESHHWQTIKKHLGYEPETENHLQWMMTCAIQEEGYIRLVFRAQVLFQIGSENMDDIWGDTPNYKRMISTLEKLEGIEIHIFSQKFYIIGEAQHIVGKLLDKLQIRDLQ